MPGNLQHQAHELRLQIAETRCKILERKLEQVATKTAVELSILWTVLGSDDGDDLAKALCRLYGEDRARDICAAVLKLANQR